MFTSCTLLTYVSQNGSSISYRDCLYKSLLKKKQPSQKMWWLLLPRTPTQAIEKKVLAQRELENGNKPDSLSRPVTNKYIHWWLTLFPRSSHHTSTSTRLQKHKKTENRFLNIKKNGQKFIAKDSHFVFTQNTNSAASPPRLSQVNQRCS